MRLSTCFLPLPFSLLPAKKPIILYYEYGFPPLKVSQFPRVVNYTLEHGFNTLMMVVYTNHEAKFNKSTIQYFVSYAESKGLKFVPSYYIESTGDEINVSGFSWVNLDMEHLTLGETIALLSKDRSYRSESVGDVAIWPIHRLSHPDEHCRNLRILSIVLVGAARLLSSREDMFCWGLAT